MTVACLYCNTEQKMFYGMWYCPKCKTLPNHYVFMVELAQKEVLDKLKEQIEEKIIIVKTNDDGTYEKVACYPRMVVDTAIDKLLNTKNSKKEKKE